MTSSAPSTVHAATPGTDVTQVNIPSDAPPQLTSFLRDLYIFWDTKTEAAAKGLSELLTEDGVMTLGSNTWTGRTQIAAAKGALLPVSSDKSFAHTPLFVSLRTDMPMMLAQGTLTETNPDQVITWLAMMKFTSQENVGVAGEMSSYMVQLSTYDI